MDTLQQKVIKALNSHGWKSPFEGSWMNSVCKLVESCAGERHATVYCYRCSEAGSFSLRADYQSEGQNVLGALWLPVPADTDDACMAAMVASFIEAAENKIAESFGVRILSVLRESGVEEAASLALAL